MLFVVLFSDFGFSGIISCLFFRRMLINSRIYFVDQW